MILLPQARGLTGPRSDARHAFLLPSRCARPARCVASRAVLHESKSKHAAAAAPWAPTVLSATCVLLSTAVCPPSTSSAPTTIEQQLTAPAPSQQQQQQRLQYDCATAPSLTAAVDQQQFVQQQQPQELSQLAVVGEARPKVHWLIKVLGIGVVNILGLWAVLKLIQWSKDSSTPVSVLRLHIGLRVGDRQLQEQLQFLRSMMSVEHGMFYTMEEAIQKVCQPPRGTQLAYADLSVTPLASKHEGYELFKQYAAVEQAAAAVEEAEVVLHGSKPVGPSHRTPLQRLMGAEETQDAEESQPCVVVSLVLLAQGTVQVPEGSIKDRPSFRGTMKQLCGHLSSGQLLAVELLITPDNPADFLSEAQLMEDYPFMTDLSNGRSIGELPARPASRQRQGGADGNVAMA